MNYRIQEHPTCTSTNELCRQAALQGAPEGLVITAEHQSAGRGRLGRSFYSPKASGLYMSLLLRPDPASADPLVLTALTAVSVCRAVEALTPHRPQIKWVNDLYLERKKLCGILVQGGTVPPSKDPAWMIVGIGVNLAQPEGGFPPELEDIATALYPAGQAPHNLRQRLLKEILSQWDSIYSDPAQQVAAREEYRRRSLLTGQTVLVHDPNGPWSGTVKEIDPQLRLVIQTPEGETKSLLYYEVTWKVTIQ